MACRPVRPASRSVIEQAGAIKQGSAVARRGLEKVDNSYDELREQALQLLEEIKTRLS